MACTLPDPVHFQARFHSGRSGAWSGVRVGRGGGVCGVDGRENDKERSWIDIEIEMVMPLRFIIYNRTAVRAV